MSTCEAGQWTLISRSKNARRPTRHSRCLYVWRGRCIDIGGLYFTIWRFDIHPQNATRGTSQKSSLTFRNAFSASSLFSFHLSRKAALRGVKLDSAVIEYQRSHMMWEQLYCNVVLVVGSGISAPKKGSASCLFTVQHSAFTHHSPNHPPVLGRQFYLPPSESGSSG